MAKLFDTHMRVVPTWLEAARYLDKQPNRRAMNLVLEIADPLAVTAEDITYMRRVNLALERSNLTLNTIAGTIFPIDFYKRYGRPNFYQRYLEMLERGKKAQSWGTYAKRMMVRQGRERGVTINPLELIVCRLSEEGQPHKKETGEVVSYPSVYELGVSDPEVDLTKGGADEIGGEIPTYDVSHDGLQWLGFPCLSHLSFKRVANNGGHSVNLTAVYRSHHYCVRALGNLIGLSQLLSFVAKESGLAVGTLTCLSTHAELDVSKWGGVAATRKILS